MIKDIIVNLSVSGKRDVAIEFAISIATTFDAHLAAVAYEYELFVPGLAFDGMGAAELIQAQREESHQAAVKAASSYEDAVRRSGLKPDCRIVEAPVGDAMAHFGRIARCFDLSVIAQPDADEGQSPELIIQSALFESGRPVLLVPYIHTGGLKLDHVTVCWDGSRAAARAIADALPFLKKSKKVEILIVETGKVRPDEIRGSEIAAHLARYDISVEIKQASVQDIDVGNAILSHVADNSSDLMVMGGYGHSRLREFILGGVTRSILKGMTIPTLMSH